DDRRGIDGNVFLPLTVRSPDADALRAGGEDLFPSANEAGVASGNRPPAAAQDREQLAGVRTHADLSLVNGEQTRAVGTPGGAFQGCAFTPAAAQDRRHCARRGAEQKSERFIVLPARVGGAETGKPLAVAAAQPLEPSLLLDRVGQTLLGLFSLHFEIGLGCLC